jgi:hypothetical protein
MEKRIKIADFAELVGTTPKTIYARLQNNSELPVNEQLKTVSEKIKGREITLIVTNFEQINLYKEIYGKNNVIEGEYYETLTDNEGYKPVNEVNNEVKTSIDNDFARDILDKLITINNDYNNRLEQKNTELITVQKELITAQSQRLLLEDKASREGLYLKEINDLKEANNKAIKQGEFLKNWLITVIILMILGLSTLTILLILAIKKPPEIRTVEVEKIIEKTVEKPVVKYVKR